MWKNYLTRPRLLLVLSILALVLLISWQWLHLAQLGHHWQQVTQRALASPLADYAEQQATHVLLADQNQQPQQLVDELATASLVSVAQLYDDSGQLLASSGEGATEQSLTALSAYVRPLYHQGQPIGFLYLHLANTPVAVAQNTAWQQLTYYLRWLLPLCVVFGLLVGAIASRFSITLSSKA